MSLPLRRGSLRPGVQPPPKDPLQQARLIAVLMLLQIRQELDQLMQGKAVVSQMRTVDIPQHGIRKPLTGPRRYGRVQQVSAEDVPVIDPVGNFDPPAFCQSRTGIDIFKREMLFPALLGHALQPGLADPRVPFDGDSEGFILQQCAGDGAIDRHVVRDGGDALFSLPFVQEVAVIQVDGDLCHVHLPISVCQ